MGRPRKNEDLGKPWVVRDVPEDVKRKVRVYAAQHDLTMAQAVEVLVDVALDSIASPRSADSRIEKIREALLNPALRDAEKAAAEVELRAIEQEQEQRERQVRAILNARGYIAEERK